MALTTKTIVFTDLADYTRNISQTDHQRLRRLVQLHESHTQAIVEPHGGRLVRNLGDSFMVLFDSATRALHACMELVSTTLDVDEGLSLRFRTSAATGDIDLVGDYFIGEAINLSARINSKTPAGEAWFSDRTRMCMNHSEIPWEPVGAFDFKGIPERVECFRAVPSGHCILSDSLEKAARLGLLQVVSPVTSHTLALGGDTHVVLSGFEPGSDALTQAVQSVSTEVTPSRIWLQAASIPTAARLGWLATGRGLVIGEKEAVADAISSLQEQPSEARTSTVFMDLSDEGDGRIEVVGIGLPAVPIAGMIEGYAVDLHPDGTWSFEAEGSILRIDVGPEGVRLSAFVPDVGVNGVRLAVGAEHVLAHGDEVTHSGQTLLFQAPGGNYAGVLTGPAYHGMPLQAGTPVELGREPGDPGLVLPDRGGHQRLRWVPGPRSEKARRAGLTLDRSMMGRRQLRVDAKGDGRFGVEPIHDRIPSWHLRGGTLERLQGATPIQVGELVLMGAYVVRIALPTD